MDLNLIATQLSDTNESVYKLYIVPYSKQYVCLVSVNPWLATLNSYLGWIFHSKSNFQFVTCKFSTEIEYRLLVSANISPCYWNIGKFPYIAIWELFCMCSTYLRSVFTPYIYLLLPCMPSAPIKDETFQWNGKQLDR